MKAKAILMLIFLPVLALGLTACGGEEAAASRTPEAQPNEARLVEPAATAYDENAEFVDAPETAPIIIDGDEEQLPEAVPASEVYQAAPDVMPEPETP